jgi:Caspase domain
MPTDTLKPPRRLQDQTARARATGHGVARRQLLLGGGLAVAASMSGHAAEQPAAAEALGEDRLRLALLIGNRDYPTPHDLPPIPKNLRDLQAALTAKGFQVDAETDQSADHTRGVINAFIDKVSKSPPATTVFFYFCGHGVQVDAANLLISAGVNPAAPVDTLQKGSLQLLNDVVARLPRRAEGMTIAVVDACRTSLKPLSSGESGLNQVEAPPGCLIAFSTGAGRPAIAPAVETANTFYTASLVKMLNTLTGEVSFSDMFRLVKLDVEQTMLAHPVEAIRKLVQRPFIAENTQRSILLLPRAARPAEVPREEGADWQQLEAALWPAEVVQRATAFEKAWPTSRYAASVKVAKAGADESARALQRPDVRLFKSAFQAPATDDPERRRELYRAARGDKDAAARLGRLAWSSGSYGSGRTRYEGWLQLASALGNGIAAYELALHYRNNDQPLLAAQLEGRARELGYNPPPSLDNVRK